MKILKFSIISYILLSFLIMPQVTQAQNQIYLPAELTCELKSATYKPYKDPKTGVLTRRIEFSLTPIAKDDFEVFFIAKHKLENREVKETVKIAGTQSLAYSPITFMLVLTPKEPAGDYVAQVIIRNLNQPCAGPASFNVSVTDEPDKFEPPASAVGSLFNPIKFGSVGEIVTNLIPNLFALATMLTFGFLVYGGIRYALSRGDAKATDSARGIITNAITGLVIILVAFVIFEIISVVLGFTVFSLVPVVSAATQVDIGNSVKIGSQSVRTAFPTIGSLVTVLVAAAVTLMGLIFFVFLLWGGMRYMLSRGDEKAINEARATITNAVVGLLIVLAAFAIITLISFLTGTTGIFPFS